MKFYAAVQTAQKVVREIVHRDEKQMENILDTSRYISRELDYYNSRVQNTTVLAETGRVPDLIGENILKVSSVRFVNRVSKYLNVLSYCPMQRIYFQNDENYIEKTKYRLSAIHKTRATSSLSFLHEISYGVLYIMNFQHNGSASATLDFLNSCFNEFFFNLSSLNYAREEGDTKTNLTTKMLYQDTGLKETQPDERTSDCQKVYKAMKRLSKQYTRFCSFITTMNMEELMKQKFPYARYSSNTQYQKCLALETEVLLKIEGYIFEFRQVEEILKNLTTSEIEESLVLIRRLLSYYDEIISIEFIYHNYDNMLNKACKWMQSVLNHQNLELSKWELKPKELQNEMEISLDKIRNAYVTLHHNYATVIQPDLGILESYLVKM